MTNWVGETLMVPVWLFADLFSSLRQRRRMRRLSRRLAELGVVVQNVGVSVTDAALALDALREASSVAGDYLRMYGEKPTWTGIDNRMAACFTQDTSKELEENSRAQ